MTSAASSCWCSAPSPATDASVRYSNNTHQAFRLCSLVFGFGLCFSLFCFWVVVFLGGGVFVCSVVFWLVVVFTYMYFNPSVE